MCHVTGANDILFGTTETHEEHVLIYAVLSANNLDGRIKPSKMGVSTFATAVNEFEDTGAHRYKIVNYEIENNFSSSLRIRKAKLG